MLVTSSAQALGEVIVSAVGLSAGYSDRMVWNKATFTINRGEFVVVIGPNGAGKTTLFRLLLGIQKPLSGRLSVFDGEPRRGSPRIGYIPQVHYVDRETHIESLELVRLGLSGMKWGIGFSGEDVKKALAALESVGAIELAHRALGGLSGGELQRIFLAEAIVSDPELLLLDEPLSNLDVRRERDLVKLINGFVRSKGATAVLVAHDINPLLPYLDKVVYVANGKVASGTPKEVLTSESLSALYDVPVEVLHDSKGNIAIIGTEGLHHEDDE